MINSVLAGVVSPLVTGTRLELAVTSLVFVVLGWTLWAWHQRRSLTSPKVIDGR